MYKYKKSHRVKGEYDKELGEIRYIESAGSHNEIARTITINDLLDKFDGKEIALSIEYVSEVSARG